MKRPLVRLLRFGIINNQLWGVSMKLFFFLVTTTIVTFALCTRFFSDVKVLAAENKLVESKSTKELMAQFLSHMEALKSFMTSDEKFSDSKNFLTIDTHLKELTLLS